MQSNRWSPKRLLGLGLVLALAWLPTACGNKNSEQNAVFVDPGTSGSTGGITGLALPGGSGSGSGTSGSTTTTTTTGGPTTTTTTGSTATTTTGSGTATTGGAAQPSPANVATIDMLSPTDNNQRKSNTRVEPIQGQIAVNQGFLAGPAQGQILLVDPTAVNGIPAPIILRGDANTSGNVASITNPWDLASDGTQNLIFTDGIGLAGQAGRVIRVTNINITASTNTTPGSANATFLNAASNTSTAIFNPLFVEPLSPGSGVIFVSEYLASPQGSIRRIDLNTGNSTTVVTGLSFPAGMAVDSGNNFLYICQNGPAAGGPNGGVLRVPLSTINGVVNGSITQPIGPSDTTVNVIAVPAGAPPFNRPWECKLDGGGGLIVAEGFALGGVVQGAPDPGGLTQGAIRYVRPQTTVANVVLSGLANCAGLTFQGTAGSENLIFFVESFAVPNGSVRSLRFDRNSLLIPTGGSLSYGTGHSFPIDTLPSAQSNGLPLKAAINFQGGGAANGRLLDFRQQ